jgi:hypothetical protein
MPATPSTLPMPIGVWWNRTLDVTSMTRTHARSTLKFPDLMPNASLHPCYSYALLQIELGSFNRYPRLRK